MLIRETNAMLQDVFGALAIVFVSKLLAMITLRAIFSALTPKFRRKQVLSSIPLSLINLRARKAV